MRGKGALMRTPFPRLLVLLAPLFGLALLGTALLTLPGAAATARPSPEAVAEGTGRMVLVLDSSGSMQERSGSTTKIEAAKAALRQVVEQLPDDAQVGVRVFGAKVFDRSEPGACTDSQNVVPVGPVDRSALTSAVADYQPYGETPIGHALRQAAEDLGPAVEGEPRTIVLLSDGEPTCQPDPCRVAAELAEQGIDLSINVVGLDVSGKARSALQCIARSGNGDYYDAGSAEELAQRLLKVSVRDLRGFRLVGEQVEGGTTVGTALPLEPGTYLDTTLPDQGARHYLLDKPAGGGVSVSALVRRPRDLTTSWNTVLRVALSTPEGTTCAQNYAVTNQLLGMTPITSTGIAYDQVVSSDEPADPCAAADQLVATVVSGAGGEDFRLQVGSRPAVENLDALPAAVERTDEGLQPVPVPASGPREPVIGGVSFDDAPELVPGTTYADTLRPSEVLVYKVRAGYGQAVRMSARLDPDPQAAQVITFTGAAVALRSYSALGQQLAMTAAEQDGARSHDFYHGDRASLLTGVVPPVRVRNAESSDAGLKTLVADGYQYFALGMGRLPGEEANEFVAPVALRVEVVGTEEGVPELAGQERGPLAEEPDGAGDGTGGDEAGGPGSSDAGGPVLWWALGGAAVLVAAAAAFALGRRSRA